MTDFTSWLEGLAEAEAVIPARVALERYRTLAPVAPAPTKREAEPDRLLKVEEAADRLGVHKSWCYRHADRLPFAKRLTSGALRFSERGLERWKESR